MSNNFFEKSKTIANDFIQSIVFLDDKAYNSIDAAKTDHDLDASKISKVFAKENKICAIYRPESDEDISNFKLIAEKADVVVLDWQIVFPQTFEEGDEEEDAPDEDPRGFYTKEIIKSILFEANEIKNSLKLIVVYTGDFTKLKNITEEIFEDVFESSTNFVIDNKNYSIQSSQIKVLIRAKSAVIANRSNKDIEKFMVKYDELSSFILKEFTTMTSGLLSNFALMSLTALRKNSSKLLGLFSSELDSAYMGHKSLLPSQEDAEDLLINLFGDSITDLLFYNKTNEDTRALIDLWVAGTLKEEELNLYKKDGNKHSPNEKYTRSHDLILGLINSKNKNIEERYKTVFNDHIENSKKKLEDYYKFILLNNTLLFLNKKQENKKQKIDQKFSILTHHKSLFIPSGSIPKLSLGTLVRSCMVPENYYLCIQQKCDSVRIEKDEERKFLFIPLIKSDLKFDILTNDGVKLKKVKDSFSIRTIKFICNDETGMIKAIKNKNSDTYIFKQKYEEEQFEWILDLKDLHSQRIIIDYTSQLSRVGLDESEWHRRSSM